MCDPEPRAAVPVSVQREEWPPLTKGNCTVPHAIICLHVLRAT